MNKLSTSSLCIVFTSLDASLLTAFIKKKLTSLRFSVWHAPPRLAFQMRCGGRGRRRRRRQCGTVWCVCGVSDRHTTDQSEAAEGFSPPGMSRLLWRYGAFQTEKRSEVKHFLTKRSEQAGTQASAITGLAGKFGAEVRPWYPGSVCGKFGSDRTSGAGD